MEKQLFREKSIERISSPEALHDYMRVTSPRLWMFLAAIIILLAGFLVVAAVTTLENKMPIWVKVEQFEVAASDNPNGANKTYTLVSATLPISQAGNIKTGMKVRLEKEMGRISAISETGKDDLVQIAIQMEHEYIALPENEYDAELILESVVPISFLWDK